MSNLDNLSQRVLRVLARNHDDARKSAKDAANHGADGGFNGFIYTRETVAFYKRNRKLIMEALTQDADDQGVPLSEMVKGFRALKDIADPIAALVVGESHEDFNQVANVMAWYALERAGQAIIAGEEA